MKWTYLLVDILTVLVPFIFSFHPRIRFDRQLKFFFSANAIVSLIFIAWDICYTELGVWGFNAKYVSGIYIYNLPVEEILFFICIPYACVFTYYCLTLFYKPDISFSIQKILIPVLALLLIGGGIYYIGNKYTAATFISLAVLLLILFYILRPAWLGKIFAIYPLLLIPFFIVNGVLTGGTGSTVVWYDQHENLGIRLWTIPLEDVFYGFEMILLNVMGYEYFKRKDNLPALHR